jgi:hypothetical protein
MRRSPHMLLAHVTVLLCTSIVPSLADVDGTMLRLARGPQNGEVTLSWDGGQSPFSAYGSADPSNITSPANLLGETSNRTWVDTPPGQTITYYHVVGLACGEDPVPVGGTCPLVCSGGCSGGNRCNIFCSDVGECSFASIACPPGFSCEVSCEQEQSCVDATILCPEDYACLVRCDGPEGCAGTLISCTQGVCDLTCGLGPDSCDNALLDCGDDACTATCAGSSSPHINCGASCSCTNDCS